jgi:hypothetical protein
MNGQMKKKIGKILKDLKRSKLLYHIFVYLLIKKKKKMKKKLI